MPIISFVIPTFNFAAFLPETLDSIVNEGFSSIEIIIFDGGSSDNTLEVLEQYRSKWPALRVICATQRGNIDTDLNQAVAASTGDYVWTMSADDVLLQGWSRIIVERLQRITPDLMLVPALHGDIALRPRRNYPILRNEKAGELVKVIADDRDLTEYLGRVRTSEGLFSFCSACLVRRDRLLAAPELEQANGTCWRYSARLITVLADYPTAILVLNKPLILKRGDNDSFAHAGLIRRLKIATVNWDQAIGQVDVDEPVRKAMLALVKSDIGPKTLLYLSQFARDRDEQRIYAECVQSRLGGGSDRDRILGHLLTRLPRFSVLARGFTAAKRMIRIVQQRCWNAGLPPSVDVQR